MPDRDLPRPDPRDVSLLIETVREAGALALTMFRQNVRDWTKNDGSPVTEADLAVDKLLRTKLLAQRPTYGWLSEETPDTADRLGNDAIWIADPIDGTSAFVNQTDEWCVAVALAMKGRPVVGVVYRPVTEQLFQAVAGDGALLNCKPLAIPERNTLDGASVIGSKAAIRKLERLGDFDHHAKTSVPLALRLCLVASGAYGLAVSTGHKNDWDLAAGDLIVHEAGGKVTGLDGRSYLYNRRETWQKGMVAAAPPLHDKVISIVGTENG